MAIEDFMLEKMFNIPFENSHAQTDSVIEDCLTPQRAYRMLGLRFLARYQDLRRCSIQRRKAQNKVKQLQKKLEETQEELKREEYQLEIEEITVGWDYEDKLANDCKQELMHLLKRLKQLPCYDRKDFEDSDVAWLAMKQDPSRRPSTSVLELMDTGQALKDSDKPAFRLTEADAEIKALLGEEK